MYRDDLHILRVAGMQAPTEAIAFSVGDLSSMNQHITLTYVHEDPEIRDRSDRPFNRLIRVSGPRSLLSSRIVFAGPIGRSRARRNHVGVPL